LRTHEIGRRGAKGPRGEDRGLSNVSILPRAWGLDSKQGFP